MQKNQKNLNLFRDYLDKRPMLVLEPSVNYRNSLKRFLQNLRIDKVVFAADPGEAKREMLTNRFGFFIVEWLLPEQNGLELCRELRESLEYTETPFLLLSTENLRDDVILATEARIDGYLLKPFSFEDFENQLFSIVQARLNPTAASKLMQQAQDKLAKKHYGISERIFRKILAEHGESASVLTGLGQIEEARQNYDQSVQHYRRALTINELFIDAIRGLIRVAEANKDYFGVIDAAHRIRKISPQNPKYTLILALAYLALGKFDESRQHFRRTVTLSPRLASAYKGLGDVYLAKKEYEDAQKNYQKALDLDQGDISILNSLGLSYVKQGKVGEGIMKYKLALRLDPFDSRVLFNLGYAYEKIGEIQKALKSYHKAVERRPDYTKALRRIKALSVAKPLPKSS